ncbi:hypothetical protein COOONC_16697 [Cooperia oncophora]
MILRSRSQNLDLMVTSQDNIQCYVYKLQHVLAATGRISAKTSGSRVDKTKFLIMGLSITNIGLAMYKLRNRDLLDRFLNKTSASDSSPSEVLGTNIRNKTVSTSQRIPVNNCHHKILFISLILSGPSAHTSQELFYCTIRNIPSWMRSKDLRRYFSDFSENGKFHCFHYRHRPELQQKSTDATVELSSSKENDSKKSTTNCCVISFATSALRSEFIREFHGRHWMNNEGMEIPPRCFVTAIKLANASGGTSDSLTSADLRQLIELRPPAVMPQGNVGTPTKYFMEQVIISYIFATFCKIRCA